MQCEICGEDIRGSPFKINIDGGELTVCTKCSQYGTPAGKRTPVSRKISPVQPTSVRPKRSQRTGFERLSEEIVDDYDQIIREARERHGWTIEELAAQIKEKATLIRKFERKELVPEDSVREKLERILEVKLIEKISDDDWKVSKHHKGTTLGDIVNIKRK
ncbi:MAG: TIGR00270 family protein [Methanomethylovorans sp.]|jgi:putative transcription factor|nr:TIGR00270 family protein [Methanomethylovorans sp.]